MSKKRTVLERHQINISFERHFYDDGTAETKNVKLILPGIANLSMYFNPIMSALIQLMRYIGDKKHTPEIFAKKIKFVKDFLSYYSKET